MVAETNVSARKRGLSVFAKISLLIATATLVVGTFIAVANKMIVDNAVSSGVYALGANVTYSVASRSGGAIRFGDTEKLQSDLINTIEMSGGRALHAVAVNSASEIVASVGSGSEAEIEDLRVLASASAATEAAEITGDGRFAAAPALTSKGASVGSVAILWSSAAARQETMTDQLIAYGIAGMLLLIISVFSAIAIKRLISKPLSDVGHAIHALADNELGEEVPHLARGDEIGAIARDVEHLKSRLISSKELEAEREQAQKVQETVVSELTTALKKLSDGDLTYPIETEFSPEYEGLRRSFNSTRATIVSIIDSVIDSSDRLADSAGEISSSTSDLAERTESQAATLEETAAAMEELTASVSSAADSAKQVESIMDEASQASEQGGQVVSNAVEAMSKIETSSSEISKIITVIDDISFQTNLLALNAGVEAARAGEAGRGFAVVASEVRALAQRSSDAAMEIKTLITESTNQVGEGVRLVGKTGDELDKIIASVETISGLISGIATGAEEQAANLGEINTGVAQLDQVTQHNAAMVEETTAASQVLRQDAAQLARVVSVFKTEKTAATEMAAPSIPTAHGTPTEPQATPAEIVSAEAPTNEQIDAFENEEQEAKSAQPALASAVGWDDF